MKTSILVFSLCALGVFAIGADVKLADSRRSAPSAVVAKPIVAEYRSRTEAAPQRREPIRVLPTVTVVADAAMIAQVDQQWIADNTAAHSDNASVMTGSVVDAASRAIGVPATPSLPRARLGNLFYDFGRRGTAPATTE